MKCSNFFFLNVIFTSQSLNKLTVNKLTSLVSNKHAAWEYYWQKVLFKIGWNKEAIFVQNQVYALIYEVSEGVQDKTNLIKLFIFGEFWSHIILEFTRS